jgi:hypothetical protein
MMRWPGWLSVIVVCARLAAAEKIFDLTAEKVGAPPSGWRSALAGEGPPGDWQVRLDAPAELATAPAPGAASGVRRPVIAQVSTDATDERYPLLIYEGETFGDFTLKLRFKTVAGEREQMAGVAFRLQDEKNFYVVRASALGDTFRFYRVFEGRRDAPIGPAFPVVAGVWHELVVEARGNKFRFQLDGQEPIPELTDSTFREGKLALWTKSDSVTYFADLRLTYAPRVMLARQLVAEAMQRYPRLLGLRIYSTTTRRPDLHVVAASNPADLGLPGGEVERSVIATLTPYAGKARKRYVTTLPLRDANGDAVAAVRVEMTASPGQTDANAVARARPIVKQMEGRFLTVRELTE